MVAYPVVNFHSRLGLAVAIPPPQDTDEFFRFAAEPLQVIVSELAPLLFHLAFESGHLPCTMS